MNSSRALTILAFALCPLLCAPVEAPLHSTDVRPVHSSDVDQDNDRNRTSGDTSGARDETRILRGNHSEQPPPQIYDRQRFSSAHESEVVDDYFRSSPTLNRVRFFQWEWDKANFKIPDIVRIGHLLNEQVPGGAPEFADFLDKDEYMGALLDLNKAWGNRPRSELPSNQSDVDSYFQARAGKTVIVVGHINGERFEMANGHGSLSVSGLLATAKRHGVLLIPIGCNSIDAGAPIGVNRNISSHEVAKFLTRIPQSPLKIVDIFDAMNAFGYVVVKVSAAANWLDVAIREPAASAAVSLPDEIYKSNEIKGSGVTSTVTPGITTFSLPWGRNALSSQNQVAYERDLDAITSRLDQLDPPPLWWQRLRLSLVVLALVALFRRAFRWARQMDGIRNDRRWSRLHTLLLRLEMLFAAIARIGLSFLKPILLLSVIFGCGFLWVWLGWLGFFFLAYGMYVLGLLEPHLDEWVNSKKAQMREQ